MLRFGTRRPRVASASSCSSARFRLRRFVVVAAGALVAWACTETPTGSQAPDALASQTTGTYGTITVEVKERGKGIDGVVVTVVNREKGPFDAEGVITKGLTEGGGIAEFRNLELGEYCAHVSPVTSLDDATGEDGLIIPQTTLNSGETESFGPAVTERQGGGPKVKSVPLTLDSYRRNCAGEAGQVAPIVLTQQSPSASVTLAPQSAGRFVASFRDLQGNSVGVSAWAVLPYALPWFPGVPNVYPGLLLSVGGNDGTTFEGLPPGTTVALEALADNGGQGLLIASLASGLVPSDGSTGTTQQALTMEPLMCTMSTGKEAQAGTATGGSLEIVGTVKDGFRGEAVESASENPEVDLRFTGASAISIWYDVVGDGDDQLQLRFKHAGGATANLNVSYGCRDGACVQSSSSGSSGATATLYQRPSEDGRIRLTWVIDDVPFGSDIAAAEYSLRDFPQPSKSDQSRAYSPIPIPLFSDQCNIDQGNDPSWWIGA